MFVLWTWTWNKKGKMPSIWENLYKLLKNEPFSSSMQIQKEKCWKSVVLGWIISLCVEPGIEPATFRFQSKVLVTPLPSLRSSSTFLFSLSLSFPLSLCFFLRFSSTFFPASASRREKVTPKRKTSQFLFTPLYP